MLHPIYFILTSVGLGKLNVTRQNPDVLDVRLMDVSVLDIVRNRLQVPRRIRYGVPCSNHHQTKHHLKRIRIKMSQTTSCGRNCCRSRVTIKQRKMQHMSI